jgi:Arc/MetJ-type ribon-helix-helix transcriptional regulator
MTTKITVSLPDEQVAALKSAVRAGKGRSVSALVSEALAEHLPRETLSELLADLAREDGPPSDEDRAWAKQALAGLWRD